MLAFVGLPCLLSSPAWADWAAERDASAGYVSVTVAATAVEEAIPFVYLKMSDLPAGFHSALDAASDTDGHTIRVSTADGSAEIACYPVGYSAAGDTGALFWATPDMSASVDVGYRIYAGNTALSMPSPGPVFADYEAFYLPGVTTTDLTGNGRDLTAVNSPGTAASGIEGITAADYSAATDYHKYDGTQAVTDWPITIEAIALSDSSTSRQFIAALGHSTNTNAVAGIEFQGNSTGDPVAQLFRGDTGSGSEATSSTGYTVSTLHHVVATRDANTGTGYTYRDGGNSGSSATTITTPTFNQFAIGQLYRNSIALAFNGHVTYVALSDSARSANYVSTMDTNWAGGLYTAGAWTPASLGSGDTGLLELTDVSSSTGWANPLYALTDLGDAATDDVPPANTVTGALNLITLSGDLSALNGQPITGIAVEVTATGEDVSTRTLEDSVVRLIIGGTVVGDNKAITERWTDTDLVTRVYGGAGDLWGVTPAYTDIQASDFGVSLAYINAGPDLDALMSVYRVRMQIWYGTGSAASSSSFFIMFE